MDMSNSYCLLRFLVLSALVCLGIMTRLLHFPPNFTAVTAVALFAGATYQNKVVACLLPITILFISDLFLERSFVFYVYLAFIGIVGIGFLLRERLGVFPILVGSVLASFFFFLTTNFCVWLFGSMYSDNLSGLFTCFVAGIPFFWNTLSSTILFSAGLFGCNYLLASKLPALALLNQSG